MDFHLTEEQQILRDTVRDFAENEVLPGAKERDATHEFPWELFRKTAELGLTGMLAAEANGIQHASHVREHFINMIRYTETLKALAKAAHHEPENFGGTGLYVANRLIANMAKLYFASNFHEFIRSIQDIAGGLLVTQPTYQDWQNEELKPYLECYLGGAGEYGAEERLKLMSSMHHMLASDFSGWHEVCTIHAEGSFAAQKMMLLLEAPSEMYKQRAKQLIGLKV